MKIGEKQIERIIKTIFNRQEVFDFKFDWNETEYFKFKIYDMDEKEMKSLWDFFGDMMIYICTEENDTKLIIKIQEKLSF